MVQAWHWSWAAVAFASELAALAALAFGGWALPAPTGVRLLAAVGAPLVGALLWGLLAAPQAPVHSVVLAVATRLVVYGTATAALAATGHLRLAAVLALAAVLGPVLSGPASALVSPGSAG
jgi:Protein of unknown function (DUF2568)